MKFARYLRHLFIDQIKSLDYILYLPNVVEENNKHTIYVKKDYIL